MVTADNALSDLLALAGRDSVGAAAIVQGAPALTTRFAADEAAAAALAAGGTIAADIWRLRTGEGQDVRVSTREAAAGLAGYTFQRFEDPSRAPPMRPPIDNMLGFTPTRDDRHVFLHPSFPPSKAKLLALLGHPEDRDAVLRVAASWNALDLEDAIAAAGVCGAMARTPQEWDTSEQGRILAARPVVEVTKIADSPPEPFRASPDMPLSGVRVLDLTRVLAGPTCARTLAQYGADVLYVAGPDLPFAPMFVSDTNHGKLSTFIDLETREGQGRLADLLRTTDVFSQGFRVGAMERRGLGLLDLAKLRPGLIYISINAYGHEGPWRGRPGWEQLAQTVTGMAHLHGGDAGPALQPAAVTDYTTGFLAAFGGLVALHRRALYGGSYMVRVSLSQTGMWVRGLGVAGPDRLDAVSPFQADETARYLVTSQSGYGPMSHLRPPVEMSATPTRWIRPTVPLGTHPAAWPEAA
jgi:crotonobetainyl-CoA:carnitine CoA-transferase CaiB-like acyl-CoA transferase